MAIGARHCSEDSKHLLIRAEIANELFARYVSTLKPNPTILKLYESVLLDLHGDLRRNIRSEIQSIQTEIADKRKQIEEVEDLMINDGTHSDRYARILDRYEKEVREMEFRVQMLETGNRTNLKPKLHYVISLINSAVMYIQDAPVEVKIKLIGLIFPEKIVFDGKNYQTITMNKVLGLICQQTNELRGSEKRKRTNENSLVHSSDSDRIQTCNLLIRSQMLYSVELRSHPPWFCDCKGSVFFSFLQGFLSEKFFRPHFSPLRTGCGRFFSLFVFSAFRARFVGEAAILCMLVISMLCI